MTSNSRVLAIATETTETSDKPPKTSNPKAYLEFDFEKHMQKLLLNGAKPPKLDENSIERFAATEIMRNGKQYYEFGPDNFKTGVIISGPSFDPKGVIPRVKDRINKEHWVSEIVIQYRKNSMVNIQQIVSEALKEEQMEVYQYLRYLNENYIKK
ncbi:uncharacterized protein LOC110177699 [Drosophila serrata]|uniref:uncharacterized protein LOC110177699 n=1 Tax=Drosophila serrata TaxID=7274 RepID=UPI000A1D05C5|nr:uncharacterized protein LOC110177699 [Drosophila serrata]XP_020800185.1 uncharacterized protein LOC110177699 [Drosophila serrata]